MRIGRVGAKDGFRMRCVDRGSERKSGGSIRKAGKIGTWLREDTEVREKKDLVVREVRILKGVRRSIERLRKEKERRISERRKRKRRIEWKIAQKEPKIK